MRAATIPRPRLAGSRPRTDQVLMIATADRGGISLEVRSPWPVFLVNGREHPDARPLITQLITDGLLQIAYPNRRVSPVHPTAAGRSKIGVSS